MHLQKGQAAPDFTLMDSDAKKVSLKDYNGKNVVLIFFPLAFTGVCTTELCGVRDQLNEYRDLNAAILAISVDSPFTLSKFKEEQNYNFPLLSDFNKEVSSTYGSLYDTFILGMKGVAKRSVFIIDKQGLIQYSEIMEDAGELPNFEKVKDTLKNIF